MKFLSLENKMNLKFDSLSNDFKEFKESTENQLSAQERSISSLEIRLSDMELKFIQLENEKHK